MNEDIEKDIAEEIEETQECKTENDWQSKLKSPVLWVALITQILSVAVFVGWIDVGTSDFINKTVAAVLQAFAAAGIINNPNNPNRI